jgi:hypothetical protein
MLTQANRLLDKQQQVTSASERNVTTKRTQKKTQYFTLHCAKIASTRRIKSNTRICTKLVRNYVLIIVNSLYTKLSINFYNRV